MRLVSRAVLQIQPYSLPLRTTFTEVNMAPGTQSSALCAEKGAIWDSAWLVSRDFVSSSAYVCYSELIMHVAACCVKLHYFNKIKDNVNCFTFKYTRDPLPCYILIVRFESFSPLKVNKSFKLAF